MILQFALVVLALTMFPGSTFMLVVQHAVERGRSSSLWVIMGGSAAVYIHALLSAVGVSLLIRQTPLAFEVVTIFGALFLTYLGLRSIWRSTRPQADHITILPSNSRESLVAGFFTYLLSPETIVFYLTVVPQFIDNRGDLLLQYLVLATAHVVVRVAWYGWVALLVGWMRRWLAHPSIKRSVQFTTGTLLIYFGLRLLFARRIA